VIESSQQSRELSPTIQVITKFMPLVSPLFSKK